MSNLLQYKFELTDSLKRLLNDDQVEGIEESLALSRRYLNLLMQRIETDLEDKIKESEGNFNYELPNWSLIQAELYGYRKALRKVKQIIGPIEETND